MTDPLDTRQKRLAKLEALACRIADVKACGLRWPADDLHALVSVICEERQHIARCVAIRAEHGR